MGILRHHRRDTLASARGSEERYGPRRLRALYEISKLFTQSVETMAQTVPALLAITSRELPLQSAILIEKTSGQTKTFAWNSPNISSADVRSAEGRALKSFNYLTRSVSALPEAIEEKTTYLTMAAAGPRASHRTKRGGFITCPLLVQGQPIFGALHLEGLAPFDEADVEFVSAIANQFAVALDRHRGRLQEIALRVKAEDLNKFKTTLVSVVSHEFGNSLTIMKMATHLLEQKLPARYLKESDQLFEMIETNIDALNAAVQNLLNMGRLEAEKLALEFKATDAAGIFKSTLKRMQLLYEKKALRVSLEFPRDPRPVRADESSLTLVLSNLFSNAIKYTPSKGRIVMGILPADKRPGYYRVFVRDTGIGIAAEDRSKILSGHFRSESGKQMTSKGFGVGLSLARQIVEAHGSAIEIEGAPGKGSCFSFLLPIAARTPGGAAGRREVL